MKMIIAYAFVVFLSLDVFAVANRKDPAYRAALRDGAMAQMKVYVVDDDGKPVEQVNIKAVIAMHLSEYQLAGHTDTNGCFVVEGKTTGNYIELWAEKDGYYQSKKKLIYIGPEYAHDVKDGKWQPYGAEEKILLRKKGAQKLRRIFRQVHLPSTNVWIGVDLKKGDLIAPFGTGCYADFEVNAQWDGLPSWKSRFCRMGVRFLGRDSGYYFANNVLESSFPYSFLANDKHEYAITYEYVDREDGVSTMSSEFERTHNMVVRSRCVHSSNGALVSAHYGDIVCLRISPSRTGKPLFSFGFVFNPVANDLNLEPTER